MEEQTEITGQQTSRMMVVCTSIGIIIILAVSLIVFVAPHTKAPKEYPTRIPGITYKVP